MFPYLYTPNPTYNNNVNFIFENDTMVNCPEISYCNTTLFEYIRKFGVEVETDYTKPGLYVVEVTSHYFFPKLKELIPDDILTRIRNNNVKLVIFHAREAVACRILKGILDEVCRSLDISKTSLTFVTGNMRESNIDEMHSHGYDVIGFFMFDMKYSSIHDNDIPIPESTTFDKRKFLCLNKTSKPHRNLVVARLEQLDLISQGHVSYIKHPTCRDNPADAVGYFNYLDADTKAHMHNVCNSEPMVLDLDGTIPNSNFHGDSPSLYRNTNFSLVTESMVTDETLFITEKTFKPIRHNHPFMIYGSHGTLDLLHRLGYRTYQCMFDESYDSQVHDDTRLTSILSQVVKDVAITKEVKNIAKYNYNVLVNTCYKTRLENLFNIL